MALNRGSNAVLNELANKGQFGTLLIEGNRFSVQYVSEAPGMAQAMAQTVQQLLNAKNVKVSKEDSDRSGGKT